MKRGTSPWVAMAMFLLASIAIGTSARADMITETGQRTPQYYYTARLNQEVLNVGQALRFLTSTDVRVVVGPDGTLRDGPHEAFRGAIAWEPGAGGEHRLTLPGGTGDLLRPGDAEFPGLGDGP